jgi:hypothetical protein
MTLRRFAFRKAVTTEYDPHAPSPDAEESQGADAGSIRLQVMSARRGAANVVKEKNDYALDDAKPVNEKDAQKKGISVGVDRAGERVTTSSRAFQFRVHDREVMDEKEIVIHVRERFWMQSRRLVDASGAPCTLKMANALQRNVGRSGGADAGASSAKKAKVFVPGEVIDLTD